MVNKRKIKWISDVNKVHNFLYDYSKVEYINQRTKVEIVCSTHGSFFQRPCDHKRSGCPKCSHNFPLTANDFMSRSKKMYGNKFSLAGPFNGMKHPITLSCNIHGEFTIPVAEVHFLKNGGCPVCVYELRIDNLKPGNTSKKETEWLDSLGVPNRQKRLIIDDTIYVVDGYDPTSNTIYEYYGSFWHGNPEIYSPDDTNTKLNKTFGELYRKTIDRENILREHHTLVTKWGP